MAEALGGKRYLLFRRARNTLEIKKNVFESLKIKVILEHENKMKLP